MRRFNKILLLALLAVAAAVVVLLLQREERPASRHSTQDAGYLNAIAPPSVLAPPAAGPRRPVEPVAVAPEPPAAPATGAAQAPRDMAAVSIETSRKPPIPTEQTPDQASRPLQEAAPPAADTQGTEPLAAAPVAPEAPLAIHRVGAGDTLYKLAKKYYGDSNRWNLIQKANPTLRGSGPKVLQVGSELVIPTAPQVDR